MTFAQRRNRLTTHFSGRIPVVKRHISLVAPVRALETYTRTGDTTPLILSLGTRWWVVSFTLRPLHPSERIPVGGWVDPIIDVDVLEKGRICCPYWDSNPGQPNPQPSHCTDWAAAAIKQTHWRVWISVAVVMGTEFREERTEVNKEGKQDRESR